MFFGWKGNTQVINFLYFFISAWIICLQQWGQNFLNSNRLGVLCRFFWVIYLEIPVDSLLTLFLLQSVHSKITVTRISFPLAMNLLWVFNSLNSSIFGFESKKNRKKSKFKIRNKFLKDFTPINIVQKKCNDFELYFVSNYNKCSILVC